MASFSPNEPDSPVPPTASCPVHHQPATAPCARCGTFICARCTVVEGMCADCIQRLGSVGLTAVEAITFQYDTSHLLRRGGALLLDTLPAAGLMWLMDRAVRSALPVPEWTAWFWFLGYFLVCEALWGCSPGKWVCGLRIVEARGQKPGWSRAARRTLARFLEANTLLCGGLPAFLFALRSPFRQRLGDRWAGTYVLTAADAARLSAAFASSRPAR